MHIIPTSSFYSCTSEGAEAANEICRAGSWVGRRLWLTGGRLPAELGDGTVLCLRISQSVDRLDAPLFYFSRRRLAPLGRRGMIRKWNWRPESVDSSWTQTSSRMLQQQDAGNERKVQLSPQANCNHNHPSMVTVALNRKTKKHYIKFI